MECRLCFERLDVHAARHCYEDDGAPKRKKKRKERKKVTFETHCEAHQREKPREVILSAARPISGTKAKEATPEIVDLTVEDTFQELDINRPSVTVTRVVKEEPKDKSMTMSQLDGLVDSEYGDTDSSEDSSEDTPQVWEVKDAKSWVLQELRKMGNHEKYSDILNYRDDGDEKWRKRANAIIGAMNRNNLTWTDIQDENQSGSDRAQPSGSEKRPSKRRLEDVRLDNTYPEWGVIEAPGVNTTNQEHPDETWPTEAFVKRISTIPLDCESEPEVMVDTEIPRSPAATPCGSPPKQPRVNEREQASATDQRPAVTIHKLYMEDTEEACLANIQHGVRGVHEYHYMVKRPDHGTEEEIASHHKRVWEELKTHGTHKINSEFWKIRGPISRADRMERVLEFWRAGDIVPRNPFLNSNLWNRATMERASRGKNDNLAGYSESGEDGRILDDIRDDSPPPGISRVRCKYDGQQLPNDIWCISNGIGKQ